MGGQSKVSAQDKVLANGDVSEKAEEQLNMPANGSGISNAEEQHQASPAIHKENDGNEGNEVEERCSSPNTAKPRKAKINKALKAPSLKSSRQYYKLVRVLDSSDSRDSSSLEDDSASKSRRKQTKTKKQIMKHRRSRKRVVKTPALTSSDTDGSSSSSDESVKDKSTKSTQQEALKNLVDGLYIGKGLLQQLLADASTKANAADSGSGSQKDDSKSDDTTKTSENETKPRPEIARLDQVWSSDEHRWVTKPSVKASNAGKYDGSVLNVVREFDWRNRYVDTHLVILSKPLKKALLHVLADVKGIALETEQPSIDPNIIFQYYDELKAYKKLLRKQAKKASSKRKRKAADQGVEHVKLLLKYVDEEYSKTKKSLGPLLNSGKINFELLWALFKPNAIIYTSPYGHDAARQAAKVETVVKHSTVIKGDYYRIRCSYLEHNGDSFGDAKLFVDISSFKGVRKITSLDAYPLKYHKEAEKLQQEFLDRGKRFASLEGMQYRAFRGIAFHKRDMQTIKVFVNGRIMLDPATFRRTRPNYPFASFEPEDKDLVDAAELDSCLSDDDGSDESSSGKTSDDDPFDPASTLALQKKKKKAKKLRLKAYKDSSDSEVYFCKVRAEDVKPKEHPMEQIDASEDGKKPTFSNEQYIASSPVILGFSFNEKLWLEFPVSGIEEIQWNEKAFDNLVIPDEQKTIVKALVESHAVHMDKNIDDVIHNKGRSLVAVLHGNPGLGKTLTAEGIAEYLHKPLYTVTVGELGMRGGEVEQGLTQIFDIAHSWGALVLLDEADIFLEQRSNYDVHRNSLVSIFLRMLEYFQGILFLTTNRVSVFDPAFASRIHIGLRYSELSVKAKKQIWKMFIEKVQALPEVDVKEPNEEEYKRLANFDLNGREIKNAVRTAQSVALTYKEPLSMKHFLQVLLVGSVFAKDLKGAGYEEAMKFYM